MCEESLDRAVPGHGQTRIELRKRLEHEAAVVQAWMWNP